VPAGYRVQVTRLVEPSSYFRWKVVLERILAALLLLPGAPLIACLLLLVRLTSRGPAIFRQCRVGKNGRLFSMYKLRTMRDGAETTTGPVWARAADPRVTRVGRVLRKLHLDELPQLFNVVKGEMLLVGPRPERPEFVEILKGKISGYTNRLAVPPGVTGLAQINLPPDSDLDSVRRKLALDLQYLEQANLWLDLRMLLCSLVRLLGMPGVIVMHLFLLRRRVGELPPLVKVDGNGDPKHAVVTAEKAVSPSALPVCRADQSKDANGDAAEAASSDLKLRPKPR